ncbi:hypothetical protein SSYM_1245 [Serratia symbiotica str. Tucson]|uniref:Uncharacterized protein n=2 Tax=Serratia symbiotica TaxID=138074 RepID=E9CLV5_9GAMM|nr:hypothetical protein [Serratia symbiotica]EFW12617.1 hypothetical protein SSYM_1245 [Serratia symbiotica str. Tucson]
MIDYSKMSEYRFQQIMDAELEKYEAMLNKSQDEQKLIGERTTIEMRGLKITTLRCAASALFPHTDQKLIFMLIHSDWMTNKFEDFLYDIVQRLVIVERVMELSHAENETPDNFDEVA